MKVLTVDGFVDDSWQMFDDSEPLSGGDLVVPWSRCAEFLDCNRPGRLGVVLTADVAVEDSRVDFNRFALVAVEFALFTDGRGYSIARTLRRNGYCGDLRAIGEVQRDQTAFLMRCGFSSLAVASLELAAELAHGLSEFSFAYQGAADAQEPVGQLRRRPG